MTSTTSLSAPILPTVSSTTTNGVSHIDLAFASAMTKGSGSIFVTDGAVQTVIDRVTGQPKLRVVGGTFTKEIMLDQVGVSGSHVSFDAAGLPPGATLNIFMGAGTLLSSGRAWAGLSAPGQATFTTPDAVVPPPSLNATIALDGDSLKSGEDIVVTITFSKAVAVLDPSLLVAANATVSGLATDDGGKTWFATLTGKAATEALASTLRLDLGQVVAGDGGRGAGVVESTSYLVDTLVAAYVAPNIDMKVDTGPFLDDGVSSDDTLVVKGSLYGTMKADEVFELVINGVEIDPAKITIKPTDEAGKSDWTYDAAGAARFNPGENTVQVRIVSAGGHSSPPAAKTIVVDTDSPDIVAAPGAAVDLAAPIQVSFNERMYWDDNPEVTRDVKVVDDFGNTSWIDLEENQLSPDGKTVTFNPGDHDLATGNTYRLYLPEGLTDLAGNAYAGPVVEFTTAGPYQDKAAPRLLQAYIVDGNGKYGTGDVLTFRLRYSEKVLLDAGTVPRLDLSNGKFASYTGLSADGTEMIFSYTVAAGDDTAALDVDRPSALAEHVRDEAGNVMLNAHIEFTDLSTAGGYGAMVEIDTIVGTLAKPQLHADSDSGTLGDFITLDTTPRLQGSGAEAGATVSLYAGGVPAGSATADANGNWDIVASALGVGNHQFTVGQQDLAGNVGERSAALGVNIIALPAAPSAPTLQAGSDTGAASSDRITADTTPTIQGSGAIAGSTLTLVHNDSTTVLVTADASGNWSHTPAALGDGVHAFTVRYPDVAGHASPDSAALSITVDTDKPNVTGSPHGATALATGADIVISFDEAVRWHGSEGNEDLLVLQAGDGSRRIIAIDNTHLSGDGKTLTLPGDDLELLASTNYRLILPETLDDLAGNRLDEYEIVFDTTAYMGPSAVRAFVDVSDHAARAGETLTFRLRFDEDVRLADDAILSIGLSNGKRAELASIDGRELLFRYVVQNGDDVKALAIVDTSLLPEHVADLSGNLLDTAHIAFDGLYDGNGYGTWLDIDTVAPSAPGAPRLLAASDTGASNSDGITNDSTPTFTGSEAEAGTTVVLKAGTREIGRTVVGEAGNWTVTVSQADALANAAYDVTIHLVDAAGNTSAASSAFSLVIDTVGPGLLGASLNPLLGREFQLRFNEEIVFHPSGRFDLKANAISLANFKGDDSGNWYRSDGAGGEDSVLNFKIALNGLLKLQMNNAAIQDLAGNAAVIGVPEWDIDLLGLLF